LPRGFNPFSVLGSAALLTASETARRFLTDAFLVVSPVFAPAALLGCADEIRVYHELPPIVALVLFGSLYRLMGYLPAPNPTGPVRG
jgi:hypothetical protein